MEFGGGGGGSKGGGARVCASLKVLGIGDQGLGFKYCKGIGIVRIEGGRCREKFGNNALEFRK